MAHIIIKGTTYIDIDMIACVQALYEVLTLQGKEVYVSGTKNYSASVTPKLKEIITHFPEKDIEVEDKLYLVDVSSTEYLGECCGYPLEQVVQIFDHHFDSFNYWKERLKDKARIEEIGAAATLVAEYTKELNLYNKLTHNTKKLIAAAIISNSQNFKLSMTKNRDHSIYNAIAIEFNFAPNWAEEYLLSIQDAIGEDVTKSLDNDMKLRTLPCGKTIAIAQMEMWNTSIFLEKHEQTVINFLKKLEHNLSFFMSTSLVEDKTYFVATDKESKDFLVNLLNISFSNSLGVYGGIIIRKEILKKIQPIQI